MVQLSDPAVRLYEQSASMGNTMAQLSVAAAYESGRGVPKSSVRAAGWYRYAAEQGDAIGQYANGTPTCE